MGLSPPTCGSLQQVWASLAASTQACALPGKGKPRDTTPAAAVGLRAALGGMAVQSADCRPAGKRAVRLAALLRGGAILWLVGTLMLPQQSLAVMRDAARQLCCHPQCGVACRAAPSAG